MAKRPRLNAMASSSASFAGSAACNCACPDGTGCAVIARAMLVVMTLMGTGEAALPVRSRVTVPAARLQAMAKSVLPPVPKRAIPLSYRQSPGVCGMSRQSVPGLIAVAGGGGAGRGAVCGVDRGGAEGGTTVGAEHDVTDMAVASRKSG